MKLAGLKTLFWEAISMRNIMLGENNNVDVKGKITFEEFSKTDLVLMHDAHPEFSSGCFFL